MFFGQFALLCLFIAPSFAVPVQFARRGEFPVAIFNDLDDATKALVTPLFALTEGGRMTVDLDAFVEDIQKLARVAEDETSPYQTHARQLLQHFKEEAEAKLLDPKIPASVKADAIQVLDRFKQVVDDVPGETETVHPLGPGPGEEGYPYSLTPSSSSPTKSFLKKVAIGLGIGGLVGAGTLGAVAYSAKQGSSASTGDSMPAPAGKRSLIDLD